MLAFNVPEEAIVLHQRDPVGIVFIDESAQGERVMEQGVVLIHCQPVEEHLEAGLASRRRLKYHHSPTADVTNDPSA